MKDFLRGTIGKLLQIFLNIIGLVFIAGSFFSCALDGVGQGSILTIVGILCLAASFGIRYWLGHIVRIK